MSEVTAHHGLLDGVAGEQVLKVVSAQLATADLLAAPAPLKPRADRCYRSNEELWRDLLGGQLRGSSIVSLPGYWLSEWFPLRPGLFHTESARLNREYARRHLLIGPGADPAAARRFRETLEMRMPAERARRLQPDAVYVYDGDGKSRMLDGGVGSIRLKDKQTAEGRLWFLGASSTPVSHEGVPVALSDDLYEDVIDRLLKEGAVRCTLTGRLRFLPSDFDPLYRELVGIPQLYLLVENLHPLTTPARTPYLATGAVVAHVDIGEAAAGIPPGYRRQTPDMRAAYVSFLPGATGSIERAAEWLAETYVGGYLNGTVLTDFDEQVRRFPGTEFSLDSVMTGSISDADATRLLDRVAAPEHVRSIFVERVEHLNLGVGVVHESRSINIGAGATVSAPVTIADAIEGSFNRVESAQLDPAVAGLLRELGKAVSEAAMSAPSAVAQELARDVESLTTELTSEAPRERWYRLALESLRETATTLGSVATPILEIITKLGPLV